MKKALRLLLVAILAICTAFSLVACDNEETVESGLKYGRVNGVITLTQYVEEEGITVLDLTGTPIQAIRAGAFSGNTTLKKIIIPSTVETIGQGAFKNMQNLEEIVLPYVGGSKNATDTKRTFGYIFGSDYSVYGEGVAQYYNSQNYTSYYIPKTLTKVTINAENGYAIPDYAFYGCKNLTEIKLSDNITGIGNYAFYNCFKLSSITVPSEATYIGASAFEKCSLLIGTAGANGTAVKFNGNKVERFGDKAFFTTHITSFNIPEGVKYIGEFCFASDIDFTTGEVKKDSLGIPYYSKLATVTFPSTLNEIGKYAFYYCVDLSEPTIASTVKVLPGAFEGCFAE